MEIAGEVVGLLGFGGWGGAAQIGMARGVPGRPETGTQIDLNAGEFGGEPFRDGPPAAVEVIGHEEMADDEVGVLRGPEEIFLYGADVIRDFGEALGAGVIAEFEIGQVDVEEVGDEFAGLGGGVGVGFPDEAGVVGQVGDEVEDVGEVDGGFAAEDHDGFCAFAQGGFGALGHVDRREIFAGAGVPA